MKLFDKDVVYAVFTTPESDVQMSAVCSFSMQTVEDVFDRGDFMVRENDRSVWTSHRLVKQYWNLPFPRPGSVGFTKC